MKYYAGIGARKTPDNILELMGKVAKKLGEEDWILRSGGAEGADSAFEKGAKNFEKQIFLPWKGFNNNDSNLYAYEQQHEDLAIQHHPNFRGLTQGAKKMMIRNSAQIIGLEDSCKPSSFVICWTKDGKIAGGTGQALRVSKSLDIPIVNLAIYDDYVMTKDYLNSDECFLTKLESRYSKGA